MPSDDAVFLKALGPYTEQVLVVVTNSGHLRLPIAQPAMLGFGEGEVEGHHLAEFSHPDDLAAVLAGIERIKQGNSLTETVAVRARRKDGGWTTLSVNLYDTRDDPDIDGVVLRISREPDPIASGVTTILGMESLAEALSTGVLAANRAGEVVYANRAAADLFGRAPDQLNGLAWHEFIDPADLEEVVGAARVALGEARYADITCRLVPADHAHRWVHARLSALGQGSPTGWVAVLTDITRQRATESDLAHRATHDPLTGLPNRLLLHDRLEQAVARLNRADDHVAVMFLDIDDFKHINDTYGHAVGDRTLCELADRIQQAIRPGDTAARVGGDEFVIIAADVDERRALSIATRVAAAAQVRVDAGSAPVHISTSIGVALAGPGEKADHVLGLADQAMYRAKRESGDRVVLADSGHKRNHLYLDPPA